jgi:membrane protein
MPIRRIKKSFMQSAPVRSIIRQSQRIYVPGFGDFTVFQVWKPFINHLKYTNLSERASAISFNVFMAIPPSLIFIFTLIPYLPISRRFVDEIYTLIRDIMPGPENHTVIIEFLNDFITRPRNELLSVGLLLALFFSSNAMMGLLKSFDRNYLGFKKRTGFEERKTALKLTAIVYTLGFICILLLVAQGAVLRWLGVENAWLRFFIHNARWIFIVLLVYYCVSFIYRQGPAVEVKWPFLTPGSLFATTLIVISTVLVSFWVTHFATYNKLYGSLGVLLILMLLIFVYSMVILLGFELNVTISTLKQERAMAESV